MANILFVVVENLRQYPGSPPFEGSVLRLVYESATPNNGMHPTRISVDVIRKVGLLLVVVCGRVMPGVRLPGVPLITSRVGRINNESR
jgi:hypothetical protein